MPDPEPTVMTISEIFTASSELITTFGLTPFIMASAVAGMGAWLFARFKRASR